MLSYANRTSCVVVVYFFLLTWCMSVVWFDSEVSYCIDMQAFAQLVL